MLIHFSKDASKVLSVTSVQKKIPKEYFGNQMLQYFFYHRSLCVNNSVLPTAHIQETENEHPVLNTLGDATITLLNQTHYQLQLICFNDRCKYHNAIKYEHLYSQVVAYCSPFHCFKCLVSTL